MKYDIVKKDRFVDALEQFRDSYYNLLKVWYEDHYEVLNSLDLDDLYPFDKSFDELGIGEWVDSLIYYINEDEKVFKFIREFWGEDVEEKFRKEF